ncbi:MAG: aminoacyl-tRNA hydrolase [Acidiferrobacterales bacterium]
MTQGIALIVGLGNPGTEYAQTRHNAGFRFLDTLLAGNPGALRSESRFYARVGRVEVERRELWLLAPATFMNHSGEAVAKFSRYYKVPAQEILVVHDDLDLPPGTVRLKLGGGDSGHNGVHDVALRLGSGDFVRLRIGIGRPPAGQEATSYVLRKAPAAEQEMIDAAIHNAHAHLGDIVHGRYQQAMNLLHAHKS